VINQIATQLVYCNSHFCLSCNVVLTCETYSFDLCGPS